ncbi:MAG: HAD-IIIA family hydrolase [Candidatus Kapabacteria bacterium]|nr:HAD-IIIA family hydrolase [Candidatus Kapabacteria bacterium]
MTNSERAQRIKLVVMDVDGTLTDGAMYFSERGEELKRFSTRDGMGVTLLHRAGLQTAIITSENSPIVVRRAEKLRITEVILGSRDKTTTLQELARRLALSPEDIAYIGDDVNDLNVMRICGLTACPSDAVAAIQETAHITCASQGGNGAVREFAEFILVAQSKPITLPEQW